MASRKHWGIVYFWSLLIRLIILLFHNFCVTVFAWTTSGFGDIETRLSTSSNLPKQPTTQSLTEHRRLCDVSINNVCYPQSSPGTLSFCPLWLSTKPLKICLFFLFNLAHSWAPKTRISKEFIRTAFQQKLASSFRKGSTAKKNKIFCTYLQYAKVI